LGVDNINDETEIGESRFAKLIRPGESLRKFTYEEGEKILREAHKRRSNHNDLTED